VSAVAWANDIVPKTGVSKGSVVTIIDELKARKIPGFRDLKEIAGELRELSVKLRKQGIGVGEAAIGFTILKRLMEVGVEPQLLPQ